FNSTAHFSYEQLIARVRQTSFLVPGLKITVIDEHVPEGESANIEEIDSPEDNAIEDNVAEDNLLENQSDNSDNSASEFEELESETTLEDEDDSEDKTENIANEDETEDAESEESVAQSVANAQSANSMQNKHHPRVVEFLHNGGVKDFVDFLSKGEAVSDIWRISGEDTYVEETQAVDSAGDLHAQQVTRKCGVDIAMRWVNGYDSTIISFVNVVETPGGGMHVDGFLQGLTKQIRKAVEDNARKLKVNLKDSNTKIERDDITAGLVAVVTVRIAEPQFQGQTKDVLGTAQVKPIVTK
ncbi:DNA topoisomerase IV subunit B, partial [Bifidobacteriaceae bacterium NR015]